LIRRLKVPGKKAQGSEAVPNFMIRSFRIVWLPWRSISLIHLENSRDLFLLFTASHIFRHTTLIWIFITTILILGLICPPMPTTKNGGSLNMGIQNSAGKAVKD